jgi:cytochrome b subunit of formate dehydrogenase
MPRPDCRRCHQAVRAHVLDPGTVTDRRKLPHCTDCHDYHGILRPRNPSSPVSHRNVPTLCMGCHIGNAYTSSVHGRAHAGNPGSPAAVCTDCHSAHPREANGTLRSLVTHAHVPETCGTCHAKVQSVYRASIHGQAVARGEKEAAVCTDCHGEHDILPPTDSRAQVAPERVSQTCAKCHADAAIIRIRGLPADRVTSYEASYHGKANRWGDVKVANCTSCHGHHDILPAADPRSLINPANLSQTCGHCHPGTKLQYTAGDVHLGAGSTSNRVVGWIRLAYLLLIGGTLGGCSGYIFFDLLAYRRARRRGDLTRFEAELHARPAPPDEALLRLSLNERVQHWILMATFILLALTGLPLLAPESAFAKAALFVFGGVHGRALLHRVAGVGLCATGVYHLGYLVLTRRGRRWLLDMLPRKRDLANVWEATKYFLGFSRERPQFARFGFPEKMEYVGVLWGTFIMGLTGFLMAGEELALRYLPKWAWDGARAVHGWEAVLAVATIALWHFYHVIWKPGVFPLSRAWLTGRITAHQLAEEHPAQYAEIMKELEGTGSPEPPSSTT